MEGFVADESASDSAITHGMSHLVGHVAVGTLADLVLWKPENFGTKPELVLKSGVIAWAQVRRDSPILGCSRVPPLPLPRLDSR